MLYMLLIYAQESEWEAFSQVEQAADLRGHEALEVDLRATGRFHSCNALQPTRTATTVRVREGKALVTDGPFAETKEQLGGYYIVDAKDLDDAIAIAARIPPAAHGSVEIRPLWQILS